MVKTSKQNKDTWKGRDKRDAGWFWINNEYLNGYAKHFGPTGTSIYISLCRHANNDDQTCFPAQKLIAEENGVTVKTVKKYLTLFKQCKLISVVRERTEKGVFKNNTYTLLNKKYWKVPMGTKGPMGKTVIHRERKGPWPMGNVVPPNNTNNINNTNRITNSNSTAQRADKQFILSEELKKLLTDKKRHIQIIGLWIQQMQLTPENKEQLQSIVKRNVRAAINLNGYSNGRIIKTLNYIKSLDYDFKIALSTIGKYIDQPHEKVKIIKIGN